MSENNPLDQVHSTAATLAANPIDSSSVATPSTANSLISSSSNSNLQSIPSLVSQDEPNEEEKSTHQSNENKKKEGQNDPSFSFLPTSLNTSSSSSFSSSSLPASHFTYFKVNDPLWDEDDDDDHSEEAVLYDSNDLNEDTTFSGDEEGEDDDVDNDDDDEAEFNKPLDITSSSSSASLLNYSNLISFNEKDFHLENQDEIKEVRHQARLLGMRAFISEYLWKRKYNLPKLLYIFKDQFDEEEWSEVTNSILVSQQLPQIYACVHIALDRFIKRRTRLTHISTFEHVVDLFRTCKQILVITGAGISVSCGIPDFRSKNGIYARLTDYELEDPTEMFDIEYFRRKPETFFSFAKEIYTSNFKPSPSHEFVAILEKQGKLLRNYTQNIDNLESVAGIERIVQCHGSFRTATCMTCGHSVPGSHIEKDIMNSTVPRCPVCPPMSEFPVMKPDIVFFGENLPDSFHDLIYVDIVQTDLVVVIGSSLKVAPVSDILKSIPDHIPQILINNERLSHLSHHFDVELLGASDTIVQALAMALNWSLPSSTTTTTTTDPSHHTEDLSLFTIQDRVAPSFQFQPPNIHIFEGYQGPSSISSSSMSMLDLNKDSKRSKMKDQELFLLEKDSNSDELENQVKLKKLKQEMETEQNGSLT